MFKAITFMYDYSGLKQQYCLDGYNRKKAIICDFYMSKYHLTEDQASEQATQDLKQFYKAIYN